MKTEIIYFSATNTTRLIVKAISQGFVGEVHFTDITLPINRIKYTEVESDLTIIATPIYGERIPEFLYEFMQQISGNGKPLVVVSVYGNMGFGISFEQFQDFAARNNFCLIAAGAFIGQHTYASPKAPVAYGRPDETDLKQARAFGEHIQKKLEKQSFSPIILPRVTLPRFITKFPDAGTRMLIRQPQIKKADCNACGACARKCPVDAIDRNSLEINEKKCLRCYACIKACPRKARVSAFLLPFFSNIFYRIGKNRKENQTFL